MREPLFVKQNIKKWEDFENVPTSNPDELANRFIQITDDLAYAKTFYPKSKTTALFIHLFCNFYPGGHLVSKI